MLVKIYYFVEARRKYFLLVANHTTNESRFPRACRANNRNETMRLCAYSLVHCLGAGSMWPKQADKSASIPDANLFSASQTVRKVIQKMTRIKITR